ncbi:MAG TPA: 3,4-dihydroxy-2-butanone-4-phosphate synthase, partial [Dehalococcoidia bacterium]|nr:3,4-dihydroxy-2-butanone-4-phosphate synthase [Dehalococcoidia bacterium]
MPFATVKEAIEEVRKGNFLIIVDDYDRENEGDLAIAAEKVTPEAINFMARHARGLICMPIIGKRLDELQVPLMVQDNTSKHGTAFTVSVEAKHHTSTGISAQDRAATIKTILDPATRPEDLARPGHTFPLRAREGGVLVRAGHTEAIVDLARLAGLSPAGAICEILNEDGSIARLPELEKL